MYLSKLEIIGFKSFANKTVLTFDSGISSIVGPNGCGKTNIVDAIRWVLGEQRYSALRSEKMEDVIFNGTKGRKPLGMAEASLVIENTKGILPSEYTQVTIGRRVYRSGESEYLLNKVPCRLKDIHTLFMDTGMGADAYSVIELKMVESILSDKTDERRHLFEEAAGVTKYKHRRKAAYRKLESVQADLVRVHDIVSEVQKAVSTLERQAKRAEQHNDVKDRLKRLEVDLLEREFAQLHARRVPLEQRLEGMRDERSRIDGALSEDEGRLEELRVLTADQERRLNGAQRDVGFQGERVSAVQQKNLIAGERRKALEESIVRWEDEMTTLGQEADRLESLKSELQGRIEHCRLGQEQASHDLTEAQKVLQVVEAKLGVKRSEMQALSEKTISIVHTIAEWQAGQDKKRGRVENLQGRSSRAVEEIEQYQSEIVRLQEEIARLLDDDRMLRRKFTEAEVRYYEEEKRQNDLKADIDAMHERELGLKAELGKISAKIEFLEGLIESREGLSEGVRFIATVRTQRGEKTVTVSDVAAAKEDLRPAIEAALGDYGGMLIVQTPEEAVHAMDMLREQGRGKVSFVCLNRVPVMNSEASLPGGTGIVGWASDLLSCPAPYRALFRFLLDRVLVVRDRKAATEVVRNLVGVSCVTLAGEIVSGVGVVRGGSSRGDEGGYLGRESQLDDLRKSVLEFDKQIEAVRAAQQELQAKHGLIDLHASRDTVKNVEKEMNAVEVRLAQLEFEKGRGTDIVAKNRQEIAGLEAEMATLIEAIEKDAPFLESLKDEKVGTERRVGALQLELELLEKEWNERSRAVNETGVALATLRGEYQNARTDLSRTGERQADIRDRLERLEQERTGSTGQIESIRQEIAENDVILTTLAAALADFEEKKKEIEEEVVRTREEIHRIEMKVKDDRRSHDDSLSAIHDLDLRIADLNAKSDHLKARAREEFEFELVLKEYPEDEFVDFASLRDEIQRLRDRIKSLGNINFAAFEEYTTEKERLEFLTLQRQDLLDAEKTLLSTIEEINTTAQRKFLDTFMQIRMNFIETFKSLFDPGDECDLRLEEGIDPLEAGIEIIAKPRGKRPTTIDLLSGGEKTLTATALLFAIYLVKPSPFCILDEVDAPLDDANIDRFTRILRKFSDNTQFIVVTHNKRTMEAANALYGVTMEEEGVSKLVTVRFNKAEVRSAALVSG